jgi:hypothetical protein
MNNFTITLLTFIFFNVNAYKILFKLPTRARPKKALELIKNLQSKLSNKIDYKIFLNCDIDDKSMNNKKIKSKLDNIAKLNYRFHYSSSKMDACNRDLDLLGSDFDVLVLLSDDMVPIMQNLDIEIINAFIDKFPNFDGIVNFNDGRVGDKLCTLPIIGKEYLKKFGYIYYPNYKSVYCDLEMKLVSMSLNKYAYFDKVLFRHDHATFMRSFDELSLKNESEIFYLHDKKLFISRLVKNFGLDNMYCYSSKQLFGIYNVIFEKSLIIMGNPENNNNLSKISKLFKIIEENNLYNKIELIFTNKNIENIKSFVCGKNLVTIDLNNFDDDNIGDVL